MKFFYSVLVVFVSCIHVFAQPGNDGGGLKFVLGGTGGVNFSKISSSVNTAPVIYNGVVYDATVDYIRSTGINGGLVVGAYFGEKFSVYSGLSYYNRAFKQDFTLGGASSFITSSEKLKVSYLNIPLLVRYKLFGERFGLMVAAGINYNIGLNGTSLITDIDGTVTPPKTTERPVTDISLGSTAVDTYNGGYLGFVLNPSIFFQAGDNGKVFINFNFDFGGNIAKKGNTKLNLVTTSINLTYEHTIDLGSND